MMQVQRLVVGGETWPVKPEIRDAIGDWEIFDANLLENPEGAVRCYVDIHEHVGDPPSLWRVLDLAEAGEARSHQTVERQFGGGGAAARQAAGDQPAVLRSCLR